MTTTTIATADELEDMLSDPVKAGKLIEDGKLRDVVKAYAEHCVKNDEGARTQVREQVQQVFAEMLRENGLTGPERPDMRALSTPTRDRGTAYNPKAVGAALDKEFDSTESYLRAVWFGNASDKAMGLKNKIRNDFSSTVGSDGGFLVPESFRSQLMSVALEEGIVRQRAMVIPMPTARVSLPVIDSTTNAGSVFGGMVAYWTEEGGAGVPTSAKFAVTTLDAKKLMGYSVVPNELFTDAAESFGAFLGQKWPQAIAFTEDSAYVSGTGVGEPLGFNRVENKAMIAAAKETNQTADTILWQNIVKMYSRMLPSSLSKAVWIANIDVFPELATMAMSVGTGGGPIWLNNGAAGPPMTILGRPVIFTEKMETLGDAGDISFVDLSYYLIGDRQAMTMATSADAEFQTDKTAVRIISRGDGRPWLKTAITPAKGANTLSPFVRLAARA